MRDTLYENQIKKHCEKMISILDRHSKVNVSNWDDEDHLVIERALQILIESVIGVARYFVQIKFNINVSKSREAFDELKKLKIIDYDTFTKMVKIIGFRNVLVHDYLDLEAELVAAVVSKQEYKFLEEFIKNLLSGLD